MKKYGDMLFVAGCIVVITAGPEIGKYTNPVFAALINGLVAAAAYCKGRKDDKP